MSRKENKDLQSPQKQLRSTRKRKHPSQTDEEVIIISSKVQKKDPNKNDLRESITENPLEREIKALYNLIKREVLGSPDNSYLVAGSELKIPSDDSCLFWSVAIGVLAPVFNDEKQYRSAFNSLFVSDDKDAELFERYSEGLKNRIQAFLRNNDTTLITRQGEKDPLYQLINWYFRQNVANYVDSHSTEFSAFITGSVTQYVTNLRNENFWGGNIEIQAIFKLLGENYRLIVENSNIEPLGNIEKPIVRIIHTNSEGRQNEAKNHYNLRMPNGILPGNQIYLEVDYEIKSKKGHTPESTTPQSGSKLNREIWEPRDTEGGGDCPFHSIFGQWNGRIVICTDVDQKRHIVKEGILAIANSKEKCKLRELVIQGIGELINDEEKNSKLIQSLPKIAQLFNEYHEWQKKDITESDQRWKVFEIELQKCSSIMQFVETHHKSREKVQDLNLKKKFNNALNSRDEHQLREMILKEPLLEKAYKVYNIPPRKFDWESHIDANMIKEYAEFVGRPRQSLSPLALQIICVVFKLNVKFKSDDKATPEYYDYGEKNQAYIYVKFRGRGLAGHYEQCHRILLSDHEQEKDDIIAKIVVLELEATFLREEIAAIRMLLLRTDRSIFKKSKSLKEADNKLKIARENYEKLKTDFNILYTHRTYTDEFVQKAAMLPIKESEAKQALRDREVRDKQLCNIRFLQQELEKLIEILPKIKLQLANNRGRLKMLDPIISEGGIFTAEKLQTILSISPRKDIYDAIAHGDLEATESFIKIIPSLSMLKESNKGTNPLQEAIFYGLYNSSIVDLLLKAGMEFDSPLMEAAYKGEIETLNDINLSGSIRIVDKEGCTALHYAAASGKEATVAWLVHAGLRVLEKERRSGFSPWLLAAGNGHLPILEYFLEEIKQDEPTRERLLCDRNKDEDTAFLLAVAGGYLDIVKLLIKYKMDFIKDINIDRSTAIHIAVRYGDLKMFNKLLEYNPNLTAEDKDGNTPAMLAAFHNRLNMLKLLIEFDKNSINKKNKTGNTILHNAINDSDKIFEPLQLMMVKFLIENGASITDPNVLGDTPLLVAVNNGYLNIVKYLLDFNKEKITLREKCGGNHEKILNLLIETCPRDRSLSDNYIQIVVLLLRADDVLKQNYESSVISLGRNNFHRHVRAQLKMTNSFDPTEYENLKLIQKKLENRRHFKDQISTNMIKILGDLDRDERILLGLTQEEILNEKEHNKLTIHLDYKNIIANKKDLIAKALEKDDFHEAKTVLDQAIKLEAEHKELKYESLDKELDKTKDKLKEIAKQKKSISDNRSALLVEIKYSNSQPQPEKFLEETKEKEEKHRLLPLSTSSHTLIGQLRRRSVVDQEQQKVKNLSLIGLAQSLVLKKYPPAQTDTASSRVHFLQELSNIEKETRSLYNLVTNEERLIKMISELERPQTSLEFAFS